MEEVYLFTVCWMSTAPHISREVNATRKRHNPTSSLGQRKKGAQKCLRAVVVSGFQHEAMP